MKGLICTTRGAILAIFLCVTGKAQQPDINSINNQLYQMFLEMEAELHQVNVTAEINIVSDPPVCHIILTVRDHVNMTYRVREIKLNDFPCQDIQAFDKYGPWIVAKQKPDQTMNPFSIGNLFNPLGGIPLGSGPSGHARMGAEARRVESATPRASGNPTAPIILDLPLAPPLSAGSNTSNVDGCDPGVGFLAFRVNHYDDSVVRIEGCPPQVTATIPVASSPLQAQFTPDNKTVVVTSYNNAVTFIDVATNKVTDTLLVGGSVFPSGLAISDDGQRAYVTSFIDFAPALLIIDVNTRTVKATLALSWPYPENVYLSPDQTLAYVTYPLGYQLDVIDVLTNTVAASLQSIPFPDAVAFNRTGTRAYVVSQTEPGTVQVLDTATNRIVDSFTVGSQPRSILLSSDGRLLAVQNYNSTFVSLIDLTTHVVSQADIGALYGMGISFLQ